jgi:hypothetical protein
VVLEKFAQLLAVGVVDEDGGDLDLVACVAETVP